MPNSVQLFPGGNKQFNALVENASSPAVNWQLSRAPAGNSDVGTITSNGYYTAPKSAGTVTVTAVLQTDPTKTGSAVVTVQGSLSLSPALASVTTSQSLKLQVTNADVSNAQVNWAVACLPIGNCSTGTIAQSGEFVPPNAAGLNIVTAALIGNPNVTGSARVEVTDFPGMLTWRNDNSRSGVNNHELALAPSTVDSSSFGKLFPCPADGPLDGYVYAQPLYVPNLAISGRMHNVVFVATEKDSVYAFDADAKPCKKLWQQSLIPAGSQAVDFPNLNMVGTNIVPFVGITGTPVIGMSTPTPYLYVVGATQTVATNPTYIHWLYALDLATGRPEIQPAGVGIASPTEQTSVFDSSVENQRPALLLSPVGNGTVYIAFGSYGGQCVVKWKAGVVVETAPCPYHGWLFGYDSSSLQQTGIFKVTQFPYARGGIWQSGGGPSADSNGNVFVATGDGPFGPTLGGMNYSDGFLRLGTAGGLSVFDYFTPCDQATLQTAGLDVGATAPVLLPDSAGSPLQPHLLIGGSIGGTLYVVDRDNMGKFDSTCSADSPPRVQTVSVGAGATILSTPVFWNNAVYVAPGNGNLQSFSMTNGSLASSSASQSTEPLGAQGATPVISWNGKDNNTAILWLIDSKGASTNAPAILRAFDPEDLSKEIYDSAMVSSRDKAGLAVKFTVPTVANGKVYVGTQTELDVYGLLP